MNINKDYYISIKKGTTNVILTNILTGAGVGGKEYTTSTAEYYYLMSIYRVCNNSTIDNVKRNRELVNIYNMLGIPEFEIHERLFVEKAAAPKSSKSTASSTATKTPSKPSDAQLRLICQRIISFFSEFDYKPSYRFVNTLALSKDRQSYVRNYFMIQDHADVEEINEKIKSTEFTKICNDLNECKPSSKINSRLEIFFGDPGAGKTTLAYKMSERKIVCSSEMLPDALMQIFDFDEGKAKFKPSDLWLAMENGETILLDEINMLPFESIKFLQGITDNKEEFDFKGNRIKINPNFKIIGTMNLFTGQGCIPLSNALADRASVIKEFVLTADDLMSVLA